MSDQIYFAGIFYKGAIAEVEDNSIVTKLGLTPYAVNFVDQQKLE